MISASMSAFAFLIKSGSPKLIADMGREICICTFQSMGHIDSILLAYSVAIICKNKGYAVSPSEWFVSDQVEDIVV